MQTLMRQSKSGLTSSETREPEDSAAKAAFRLNESSIGVEIDFAHVLRHSGPPSTLGSVPLPLPWIQLGWIAEANHEQVAANCRNLRPVA